MMTKSTSPSHSCVCVWLMRNGTLEKSTPENLLSRLLITVFDVLLDEEYKSADFPDADDELFPVLSLLLLRKTHDSHLIRRFFPVHVQTVYYLICCFVEAFVIVIDKIYNF